MKNLFFITTLFMGVLSMDAQITVDDNFGFCVDGIYNPIADQDGRPAYANGSHTIRWSAGDNHWRIGDIDVSEQPLYTNTFNSLQPPCSATQPWTEESSSCGIITVTGGVLSPCGTIALPTTRYVNKAASGANDGTSWTNAYTDLQDAIGAANAGDEIWVVAGTYKPTVEHDADGMGADVRERTFYINQDGIKIYGGFAGTETMLSQRNHETNVTTLSGDFNDDDVVTGAGATLSFSDNTENAYHVVFIDGTTNAITNATVIDGFMISGGNGNGCFPNNSGGGIFNDGSSSTGMSNPTISNCDFLNNYAEINGGGIYNYGANGMSSPTISNCDFSNNSASQGGGIHNGGFSGTSSPTISNCSFSDNVGDSGGGGIHNIGQFNGTSSPSITNCSFSDNVGDAGGGISNNGDSGTSSPTISNCDFSNNSGADGGGIYNYSDNGTSSPTISNCDFSNNNVSFNGDGIYFVGYNGSIKSQIINCLFNSNGEEHIYYNDGTANQQPHFINCTFTGATTRVIKQVMDGGMTPVDFTNCIFWDNNGDITNLANTNVNLNHCLVEEAAFVGSNNNIGGDPVFNNAAMNDFSLKNCSPALNVGDNAANTSTTDLAGNMRKFGATIDLGAYEFQAATATCCPSTIFVKHDATAGNNDGTSWTDAYTNLQDAIDDACATTTEIWVAAGTYKPTVEHDADGMGADVRERTFYINQDGIKIYGGFAGTETMLSQRNHETNVTTLSGDFNDDDVVTGGGATLSFSGNTENAYHVVFIDGTTNPITTATVIDGFTISGGNGNGSFPNNAGGGMYNDGNDGGMSNPTVSNCDFSNNSASNGGGMYNNGFSLGSNSISSPTVSNCDFSNNHGGMYNDGSNGGNSNPTVINCDFSNNSDSGMSNYGDQFGTSSPTVSNCNFSNNYTLQSGGGMHNSGTSGGNSNPTINNCDFSNNSAVQSGGGIYNNGFGAGNSNPTVTNCEFSNNSAGDGDGMSFAGNFGNVKAEIINCLFNSNGEEHVDYDDGNANQQPHFINCTFTGATTRVIKQEMDGGMTPVDFTNCIFWDNNGDITNLANTNVNLNHCLVEEAAFVGSNNNIGGDPLFTDATNGDFSLKFCSPAIDVGDKTANTTTTDLAGNNRIVNIEIDLGAYENDGMLMCPSISVATTTASVTEQNTNKLIYEFTRQNGDLTQSLEINFQISTNSTAATTDYTVTEMGTGNVDFDGMTQKGTITFPANQTTVQLEIMPTADNTVEGGETVIVQLIAAP